jgi:hypothetical protein
VGAITLPALEECPGPRRYSSVWNMVPAPLPSSRSTYSTSAPTGTASWAVSRSTSRSSPSTGTASSRSINRSTASWPISNLGCPALDRGGDLLAPGGLGQRRGEGGALELGHRGSGAAAARPRSRNRRS